MSLALALRLEVPEVHLSDKGGEAAFMLMEMITGEHQEEEEEDSPEAMKLDWEDEIKELSPELKYLWSKAKAGDRLDLKSVLADYPRLQDLPLQPPQNNHKPGFLDKQLRQVQSGLLHGLRIMSHTYTALQSGDTEMSPEAMFQMVWKHWADMYCKINEQRQEFSIPGSTSSSAVDPLFTKTDLLVASTNSKIKNYRSFRRYPFSKGKWYSFRDYHSFGKGQFKSFKGSKGFGRGFGGKSFGGRSSFGFGKGYGSLRPGGKSKGKGVPTSVSTKHKSLFSSQVNKGYSSLKVFTGHGVPSTEANDFSGFKLISGCSSESDRVNSDESAVVENFKWCQFRSFKPPSDWSEHRLSIAPSAVFACSGKKHLCKCRKFYH
jgi:hypothetical protein